MAGAGAALRFGFFVLVMGVGPAASAGPAPALDAATVSAHGQSMDRYLAVPHTWAAPLQGALLGVAFAPSRTVVGISALALRHRRSAPASGGEVKLELGYGGFTVRQLVLDTGHVAMSAEVIAGGGLRCRRRTSVLRGSCPSAESFGLVEGGMGADVRPAPWLTLTGRVGYRWVFAAATEPRVEAPAGSPSSHDLSGLFGSVQVMVRM